MGYGQGGESLGTSSPGVMVLLMSPNPSAGGTVMRRTPAGGDVCMLFVWAAGYCWVISQLMIKTISDHVSQF